MRICKDKHLTAIGHTLQMVKVHRVAAIATLDKWIFDNLTTIMLGHIAERMVYRRLYNNLIARLKQCPDCHSYTPDNTGDK